MTSITIYDGAKTIGGNKIFIEEKFSVSDFKDEIRTFISIIPAQGHLIKLSEEYQNKFFKITEYMKKQYGHSVRVFSL